MSFENYECDGQLSIADTFLICDGCKYEKNGKCYNTRNGMHGITCPPAPCSLYETGIRMTEVSIDDYE